MNLLKQFILFLLACCISVSHGSITSLKESFIADYFVHYESGRCGPNIMDFIRRHHTSIEDWSDSYIVFVTNKGTSYFGLLNVEQARSRGSLISEGHWAPGNANFYHHVFLDYKGHIIDFDFTNEPKVESKRQYLEEMFLIEEDVRPVIGRETKLKDYKVEILSVEDYLNNKEEYIEYSLNDYYHIN